MFQRNFILRAILGAFAPYMAADGDGGGSGTGTGSGAGGQGGDNGGGGTGGQGGGSGAGGQGQGGSGVWYDSFKDPEVKDWLKAYAGAYPDPEAVARKALHLEKFVGADKAGRGIIAPKPDAKPEEWQAFYRKVSGVPEKLEGWDGYKAPDLLAKDPVAGKFKEFAHKIGLPPMYFEATMGFVAEQMQTTIGQQTKDFEARGEKDMQELRAEWKGQEYDANTELGRRAAKAFVPHANPKELEDTLTRIEGAIGTKAMMKMFAAVGKSIGEHGFVSGEQPVNSGGMTPEGARMKILELQRDQEWSKKFVAGDVDAKTEWERLHKIGYGQQG